MKLRDLFIAQQLGGSGGSTPAVLSEVTITENGTYEPVKEFVLGETYTFRDDYTYAEVEELYNTKEVLDSNGAIIMTEDYVFFAEEMPDGQVVLGFISEDIGGNGFIHVTEKLIEEVGFPVTEAGWYDFDTMAKVDAPTITLPTNAEEIFVEMPVLAPIFDFTPCDGWNKVIVDVGLDYNNSDVTIIPDYAFYGCEDLKSVDCCNLTSIGTSAFEDCTGLKSIILYDSITSIGENAFKGCSENLIIYSMFYSVPEGWHENWNPDNCQVISLVVDTWNISATTEDNVTATFYKGMNNKNKHYLMISGNGNMKDYTSSIEPPWYQYRFDITSITISDSVTNIGDYVFRSCSLTSIMLPDSVTSIGDYAFYYCTSLTSATIGNSVTSIGDHAFHSCINLTSITIPDSVTSIGDHAFNNCNSLMSITIPDSVTSIGERMFSNCGLTSITIPDSVTSIGSNVFTYCKSLANVTIGNSVTTIGSYAFSNCTSLTSIVIPDSVTSIGDSAFSGCSNLTSVYITDIAKWCAIDFSNLISNPLKTGNLYLNREDGEAELIEDLVIPDGVTSIGYSAFVRCTSLASVIIPDSVTSIGDNAFWGCNSLASVIIPNSVTSIGGWAFGRCSSLASVTFEGTIAQWNAIEVNFAWAAEAGNYIIHCLDGDISKDGTITYH